MTGLKLQVEKYYGIFRKDLHVTVIRVAKHDIYGKN